jgi:serine/threonine protein kinase
LKVLDFGIAKIAAETTASHTAAVGTPMWMAPEQTSPGQPIAPQTDIWALGLIAFWLLTGRSYWRASNEATPTMAMFFREILIDDIALPSVRSAFFGCGVALSPEFDKWFARCLQRDPKARY